MSLHFVPADRRERCHGCEEIIEYNALMIPTWERSPRDGGGFHRRRVVYCEACGRLLVESLWKSGKQS